MKKEIVLSKERPIRELLYQQFNARICLVDIYYIHKQIEAMAFSNKDEDLLLPCEENTDETRTFLEKNGYGELIFDIVSHAGVSDDLENSLLAHYDLEMVEMFKKVFVHPFDRDKSIAYQNEGLKFTTNSLMADVVRYPLSQFHTEVMKACKLFLGGTKLVDKGMMNLYMESYSPSFLTQFAQYWVAEKLDMLNFPSRKCVI